MKKLYFVLTGLLTIALLILVGYKIGEEKTLAGGAIIFPGTSTACTDECTAKMQTMCVGKDYKICGNYDGDTCLEWSDVIYCKFGCLNGACPCTDSDDGAYPDKFGIVTISNSLKGVLTTQDKCQGEDVLEATCSPVAELSLNTMSCGGVSACSGGSCNYAIGQCSWSSCTGKQCLAGACRLYTCTDSDSGSNLDEKGTATVRNPFGTVNTKTDECAGERYIYEATCESAGEISVITLPCGPEKICYDGACEKIICIDSDGMNENTKGTVTVTGPAGTGSSEDWCSGSSVVYERYCLGNNPAIMSIPCASSTCKDGACI